MKRRIITSVTVCVFLALVLAVRLSDREKNDNRIPSKETVAAYILEKGEQYAAEQLRTQDRDSLRRSWGEPDVMPSGIWADVWDLDADTTILIFYDAENDDKVERAALGKKQRIAKKSAVLGESHKQEVLRSLSILRPVSAHKPLCFAT